MSLPKSPANRTDATVFERVAPVVDFPAAEAAVRQFWADHDIVDRSLAKRAGGPRFVFYEGPPTANGLPHNGSALTRVMKDVFPRYKAMRGFDVPRRAGWDTHGLPVEIEVEKELRISGKDAIVDFGVEPFVKCCLDNVFRYTEQWQQFTEKLGFWLDLDNAYVTYHESYVESVWWALSKLFEEEPPLQRTQGRLVVGAGGDRCCRRPKWAWDTRPSTIPSVFVSVSAPRRARHTSLLVWTTTPWTLPSNSLAAVKADVDYAVVRDGDGQLIVAEALLDVLREKTDSALEVVRRVAGSDLVGQRYQPPFDWFERDQPDLDFWRVVAAEFVELDAGTGVVHIAPAFGEIDFELLRSEQQHKPDLPLLNAVRPDGCFDPDIAEAAYLQQAGRVQAASEIVGQQQLSTGVMSRDQARTLAYLQAQTACSRADYKQALIIWKTTADEIEKERQSYSSLFGTLPFAMRTPNAYFRETRGSGFWPIEQISSLETDLVRRPADLADQYLQVALTQLETGEPGKAAEILRKIIDVSPDGPIRPLAAIYFNAVTGEKVRIEPEHTKKSDTPAAKSEEKPPTPKTRETPPKTGIDRSPVEAVKPTRN